jgi:hypothetical protein
LEAAQIRNTDALKLFAMSKLSERPAPCSLGLSATSQQYFSLTSNQPPATSQQYSSLRTNQHQPLATSQPNRLKDAGEKCLRMLDFEFVMRFPTETRF